MNILAVADYSVLLQNNRIKTEGFEQVDLILSCGDLSLEYLSALSSAFDAPLYFVKGNHDIRVDGVTPDGCFDIHAKLVQFNGVNILGLEGCRWYNGGLHQYTEAEMRRMVSRLKGEIRRRGSVDIIVTHAAPRHIHDGEDQCHQGFKCFRSLIRKYKPLYFLHGHIHGNFPDPSERITRMQNTSVVNCCGYYYIERVNEKIAE